MLGLLRMPCGIYSHGQEHQRHHNEQDSNDSFHSYNPRNSWISCLIRRCRSTIPTVMAMTARHPPASRWRLVLPALEINHPNKLISVTTITPSQNLRYAICSLATSISDIIPNPSD